MLERLRVCEGVAEDVAVLDAVIVAVPMGEKVAVDDADAVGDAVELVVAVIVEVIDDVQLADCDEVPELVGVRVDDAVVDDDSVGGGVLEGERGGERVPDTDREAVATGDTEWEMLRVPEAVSVLVDVAVIVEVIVGVSDALEVSERTALGKKDSDAEAEADNDGEDVGVGNAEGTQPAALGSSTGECITAVQRSAPVCAVAASRLQAGAPLLAVSPSVNAHSCEPDEPAASTLHTSVHEPSTGMPMQTIEAKGPCPGGTRGECVSSAQKPTAPKVA